MEEYSTVLEGEGEGVGVGKNGDFSVAVTPKGNKASELKVDI